MKILAVSDEEDIIWNQYTKEMLKDVELIVSCGDLSPSYLDYLVSLTNLPLFYVYGNHDDYTENPPKCGVCIDGKIRSFKGYSFMGLGGCMRYKDALNMYTEEEMSSKCRRLLPMARIRGVDFLVTHAPAKGYGDLEDYPHNGFDAFNKVMNKCKPSYMFHGHVHTSYGIIKKEHLHPSGTKIINVCGHRIIKV